MEHSNGTSRISVDMEEFRDTINSLEVEDISSTGFQFTWTKSHKNHHCGTLKKLHRIMVNDMFLNYFGNAHVAEDELKFLHQKAKVQWLKEGDRNNSFFHSFIKAMKHKSRVESICCEDRRRVEGDAFFDIDSSKAVGPDGYTSCFFEKAWHIIGNDICLAVRELFQKGRILGEINATLIELVPKIDTPDTHIQDNILITQELLKGYNRKTGAKRCAMKIDIQKAYDTINWDFLKEVMLLVGLHEVTVHWMMTCITTPSFSICVNAICMELKLTHICFADDLMVLCNGDVDSLKVVKRALDDFSSVSWLHSNLSKSTIFFGSINERDQGDLLQILPFKCGKLPMKYLGVPLLAKRLGVKDCKILIENVENRINC
ncbi:RNA-directed DNA polymerase, eukaryota, reverse transcriptase zinc-binding domain protein [Tanacetum coccineum]